MTTHITAIPLATGNDELERYALDECSKLQRTDRHAPVLVVPKEGCEMAIRFARCGAEVVVRDSPGSSQDNACADFDQQAGQRRAGGGGTGQRWGIDGAVGLCCERNFFMLLEAGTSVPRMMTTIHDNVKSVAVRV